jgi:glycosyltransferase involved in cell wall biosynthesis
MPKRVKHKGINFLYAGRILEEKGVGNILISFNNLLNKYDNINLYIAGSGEKLEEYKNQYKHKNINFLGQLDFETLLKYYAKTDVFLYPSMYPEGLPTSILEAGLMGCSVIGTLRGGSKEVLNSKNSIIVEENQKSLEKAMKKMIDDEKFRVMSAKNMNEFVMNNFSWEVTAQKVLKDMGIENE